MTTQLNQAVSKRLLELLTEKDMTQYQLYMKSGLPKSTIGNVVNCTYDSVKLRVLHERDRRKFCVIDNPRQYENLRLSQE